MGIHNSYVKTDSEFANTPGQKIILNDLPKRTSRDRNTINNLLVMEVGEEFDNVPQCSCGSLSGAMYRGVRCTHCDTIVEELVGSELTSKVWIRTPNGIPALMNPQYWNQLRMYLMRGKNSSDPGDDKSEKKTASTKFDLLQWLTNPTYRPEKIAKTALKMIQRLEDIGMNKRGYIHFYDNFDTYLPFLLTDKAFRKSPRNATAGLELLHLFQKNRENVWQQYIKIPNRAVNIIEQNNSARNYDPMTPLLLRAVREIVGIDDEENSRGNDSIRRRETQCSKLLTYLSDYSSMVNSQFLGSKHGLIRKNVIAGRSNYTGRFVVTAISTPHEMDEVHLPWVGFMGIYEPQIRNVLSKRYGFSAQTISRILTKYQRTYHPELYKIMTDLIQSSRGEDGKVGLPLVLNRNPTLKQGSIVLLRCTMVKTDVRDLSASTSGQIAPLYNGDFDGDEETLMALVDKRMVRAFEPFLPKYSVGSVLTPYEADGVVSITKQTTINLSSGILHQDKEELTDDHIAFMDQFSTFVAA